MAKLQKSLGEQVENSNLTYQKHKKRQSKPTEDNLQV